MEDIIKKFSSFTHKPVRFLEVQNDVKEDIKGLVKTLYDYTKAHETLDKTTKKYTLPKLIVDDFDNEQIWQQIELQNTECWDKLVWDVANCISSKYNLDFPINVPEDTEKESQQLVDDYIDEDEHESEDKSDLDEDGSEHGVKMRKCVEKRSKTRGKPSVVDDKFFKLNEMEEFLLKEEKVKKGGADNSDEDSIDFFEDIDDSEQDENEDKQDAMYSDFFDKVDGENNQLEEVDDEEEEASDDENSNINEMKQSQSKKRNEKKVTFADTMSDDNSSASDEDNSENKINNANANEKKSDFELRQQRLQQTITRLEEKSLKEAPWQLKGEVNALKRPQNSLLEEVVDFDLTSRPPPLITEQTTVTLEDIIRQRIKDKAWDDVVKKEKPVDDQLSFRKTEVLDHSKSKLSLAQVYEAEYLKQKQALSGETEEEKEPDSHTELRNSMSKLFSKLDALCNYHYTPKAPQAEVKIVSNTPAISMEEVAPVATSDATLLAPEEVKKKHRGELQSKEERTQTDKNRERRKKKKLQHKKGNVEKVTDHRNTKKAVDAADKSLKTSKAFFQQLNDDATSALKKKNKPGVK